MINLILFGPPGSGKGTQAAYTVEKYGLHHISTGDLFRREIKGKTALGLEAVSYSSKGHLVPDSITIGILRQEVEAHPGAKGFIFDGFPRTVPQAAALDIFLSEIERSITCLIELRVNDEELTKRLLERGKTSERADDQEPAIIANRIQVYKDETIPVALHYAQADKAFIVDGVGSMEQVFDRICYRIEEQSQLA
ncbi:MAG: adenylate kinase [Maribacter sp.]|jgi:adenylate kinase